LLEKFTTIEKKFAVIGKYTARNIAPTGRDLILT